MKRIKNQMLNDELAGFEFTEEMQRQVLNKIEKKHGRKHQVLKPLLPITLTAAFLVVSSAGIYHITTIQNQPNQQSEETPVQPPAEKEEEKPAISLYVPEGYEFKHIKTNDDVYEQLYVNKDTDDSFSYRMQNKEQTYPEGTKNSIRLSQNLQGTMIRGQDLTALTWEHDGYFHILEQKGSMEEDDFLKISYSILVQQDLGPYLGDEIEKMETGKQDVADTIPDNKEPMNEVPSLTEEGALDILKRFEEIYDSVYETDGYLKSAKFKTKNEFYEAFSEVMTAKEAEKKFVYRMTEKQDGLYFIPMDGILTWSFELPYDFEKVNERKYIITQQSVSDLHGHGPLSVTFEYMHNSTWIITHYGKTEQEHQVDKVPALTEEQALDIIRNFEKIKDNNYRASENLKIDWFKTKDQFYRAFASVMTKEEAERNFNYRITEKEEGLYMIPMDGLQSWAFQVPHEYTKINEKKYTISQYREDDLHGDGTFSVTFEYMYGTTWIITHYGK